MSDSLTVRALPLDSIVPDPGQPRREFAQDELGRLAANLKAHGQKQAIKVHRPDPGGPWVIVYGERRWRAARLAGLPTIAANCVDRAMGGDEVRVEQLTENLHRADMTAAERGAAYRALMELKGWTARELADAINVHEGNVSRALAAGVSSPNLRARKSAAGRGRGKPDKRVFRFGAAAVTVADRKRLDGTRTESLLVKALEKHRRRLRGRGEVSDTDILDFPERKSDAA
jgi:ParB/RepB/Spo0J family partition protein